jgi:integrase
MPQKPKPPRLWLRTERRRDGTAVRSWCIKDAGRTIRTGCAEDQIADANRFLASYTAAKFEPRRGGRSSEVTIGDVLLVYDEERAGLTSRPTETRAAIARLNDFMGGHAVADLRGKLCRAFVDHRNTASGARRDLEVLRAATNYYHAEHGLDVLPRFTLPAKGTPRQRFLTRQEAAALLWACMGWEKVGMGDDARWTRRKGQKRMHLARLILIGLYTGTRPGAIKSLQWIRNTSGGWVDLDRGVVFRRAEGERVAHNKRKPPVKMARRLMAHAARWKRLDGWKDDQVGLRYVVHYLGNAVTKENKAFRSAVAAAGLSSDVTPHILRHTRGTWLAQAGVPATEAAASLGLTVEEYERTYLHNDPAFQQRAADAF